MPINITLVCRIFYWTFGGVEIAHLPHHIAHTANLIYMISPQNTLFGVDTSKSRSWIDPSHHHHHSYPSASSELMTNFSLPPDLILPRLGDQKALVRVDSLETARCWGNDAVWEGVWLALYVDEPYKCLFK